MERQSVKERKKRVVKVQQEEETLYGFSVWKWLLFHSNGWVKGDLNLPPGDFETTQTWLRSDRLKMAGLILLFKLHEMPQVNPGHKALNYSPLNLHVSRFNETGQIGHTRRELYSDSVGQDGSVGDFNQLLVGWHNTVVTVTSMLTRDFKIYFHRYYSLTCSCSPKDSPLSKEVILCFEVII